MIKLYNNKYKLNNIILRLYYFFIYLYIRLPFYL